MIEVLGRFSIEAVRGRIDALLVPRIDFSARASPECLRNTCSI
jgi:hypothetical protein